jgi:proteasome lid subunit RPN8/RPN11
MTVHVSRRLLDHFRREAKQAYPKEAYAILIGKIRGDQVSVTQLFIPDNQRAKATPDQIEVAASWREEAYHLANAAGEQVLGDLHSHTPTCTLSRWRGDSAPSEGDWKCASEYIHAICTIYKYPTGRMVARITFWPSDLALKTCITE